jgi:hypothetical protein
VTAGSVTAGDAETVARIVGEVRASEPIHGIRIVGIDGPSGSGKSTLGSLLAAALNAPLIRIDDFVSWPVFAAWWPRFETQVLWPLLAGSAAHWQVRDWAGDEFGTSVKEWRTQPWTPIVLIEGVTCCREAASPSLAYSIWVETPAELRLERGIERDGESHRPLWDRWMREEEAFFASDGTRDRVNLIVSGTGSSVAQER